MGNAIGSAFSGFGDILGKVFGHPIDFLAGKSCDSVCGPTWDLSCYIENFCIARLAKLLLVSVLFYFVLIFFYLLYKLGICHCICHIIYRLIRACFSTCFYGLECCCTSLCSVLDMHNQRRRERRRREMDIEEMAAFSSEEGSSPHQQEKPPRIAKHRTSHSVSCSRRRDSKQEHLRKSLRPKSHSRTHVEISTHRKSGGLGKRKRSQDDHSNSPIQHVIRVKRASKFAQKGSRLKHSAHQRRRGRARHDHI